MTAAVNWFYLFPIVQHRFEYSSKQLEIHDKVDQVYGEVEEIPLETNEAQDAVENMVQTHLKQMAGSGLIE